MNTITQERRRSKKVRYAVALLFAALGVGVCRVIVAPKLAGAGLEMFVTCAFLCFFAVLVVMIGLGKNWARLIYLGWFFFGLILNLLPLARSFSVTAISTYAGLVQLALQAVALAFLFHADASEWFAAGTRRYASAKKTAF